MGRSRILLPTSAIIAAASLFLGAVLAHAAGGPELKLLTGSFDPLVRVPEVEAELAARTYGRQYIVQFKHTPLDADGVKLRALGANLRNYLPSQAHIVEMDAATVTRVRQLSFVRWVGPYHPAYKLEPSIRLLAAGDTSIHNPQSAIRYHIMVFERGLAQKQVVADRIKALGGTIDAQVPSGFLLEATLTPLQLRAVAHMDEVACIDRWSAPTLCMDIAREVSGANFVETVAGYSGAGVRGEVQEFQIAETTHGDFQVHPPIVHTSATPGDHPTETFGVLFGSGAGNEAARGILPDGQGITSGDAGGASYDIYQHTAELLQAPYFACFQSNSFGQASWPNSTTYSTLSAQVDDVFFQYDLCSVWALGNYGIFFVGNAINRQANAKNVVSVGGIQHQNTLDKSDDSWSCCAVTSDRASYGPTADGRIKPDLAHFYDNILTTTTGNGYVSNFGGTSAATPITAGCFGLMFQMWNDGLFGNTVPNPGGTVFENRPHAATAKALIINTASQYPFSGAGQDLGRFHQGWGMADVRRLYDLRNHLPILINETDILSNQGATQYPVVVANGAAALRATLAYTDPAGLPSSSVNRVNDLTLHVTSPSGIEYWGNNGLTDGNWSTPGGSANTIDNVENVFVQAPEAGAWAIEVRADELNEDGHPETPELDADYALVVSLEPVPVVPGDIDGDGDVDSVDVDLFTQVLLGIDTGNPGHVTRCDLNDDGTASGQDIQAMVAAVLN